MKNQKHNTIIEVFKNLFQNEKVLNRKIKIIYNLIRNDKKKYI